MATFPVSIGKGDTWYHFTIEPQYNEVLGEYNYIVTCVGFEPFIMVFSEELGRYAIQGNAVPYELHELADSLHEAIEAYLR